MKKLYEAPVLEFSEFEVEDIIMESISLGQANLEQMEAGELEQYNAVMAALRKSYTVQKYSSNQFKGW